MRDEVADDAAPTVVDDGASGDGRDGRTVFLGVGASFRLSGGEDLADRAGRRGRAWSLEWATGGEDLAGGAGRGHRIEPAALGLGSGRARGDRAGRRPVCFSIPEQVGIWGQSRIAVGVANFFFKILYFLN